MEELSRFKVDIHKWLWTTEINYSNVFNNKLSCFMRHNSHNLLDYLSLYQSEQEYKNFLKFSKDLSIIIDGYCENSTNNDT